MLWKSCNEIHRNLLKGKGAFFRGDAIERHPFLMSQNFILLADCTSFYVVGYPLTHPHPWQDFGCFLNCLVSSRVSCRRVVMDEGHKVLFGRFWELHCMGGIDEEFWFEKGLIPVVVVPLV